MKNENLKTTSQIIAELKIPFWKLNYYLMARHIEPTERVGHIRLFDESKIQEIKKAVEA